MNLDTACIQLHSGLDMLYTVHEAMADRPDRQTNYAKALYGVYDYLKSVESNLAEIAIKSAPASVGTPTRA